LPGDTILITGEDGHIHEEPDTILISNKINIRIQTDPLLHVIIKPLATSGNATFKIENSSQIWISGLKFLSATPGAGHAHAVLVQNSSGIKILGNEISEDWECHDVPATELFKCDNSSVELTGNFCNYIENSFPSPNNPNNFFSFISLSGNGDYLVKNCAVSNVHSNSGYAYGIKVYPDTRSVEIDDFSAEEFVPSHTDYFDKMVGILVESDNSPVIFKIANIQLNKLGFGVCFEHTGLQANSYLKKALIKNCVFAGIFVNNLSVVKDFRNITIARCLEGIHVKSNSSATLYNTIVFACTRAFRCEISSLLKMLYSVYYQNTERQFTNNGGVVNLSQFIRNIDPRFVNESQDDFNLTDYSPCVDTGFKFTEDTYLGNGPDIGYFEKTALITEDDLPSLLARASRYSEIVPLTEIDVIGMVIKGIETSDGRILAGREGSAVKDIAVKPLDLLITPFQTELEIVRERMAFSRLENLSDLDGDLLASNVFVERDYGSKASGIVRIYFAEPADAIIYAEHEFKTREGYRFYCRATVAITKDEMALNYDNGTYYFDIVVDAEVADLLYNLPANTINISTMPLPLGTLSFTNPYEISGGYTAETNEELYEKCQYGITVRDIVTKKGARAIMRDMFPFISDMRVIGYRDAEMERDYYEIVGDHIGGKSDIYIKTRNPVQDSKVIYPDGKYYEIDDASFSGFVPILKIDSIEILEPVSENETGIYLEPVAQYNTLSRDSLVRFSIREKIAIEFSDEIVNNYMPNTPFKVYFTWVPELKSLQSIIEGDDERVVVADMLARCFEPAYVSFSMAYLADEELPDLEDVLRGFIRGVPAGSELQESDLVNMAYSAGVGKVLQPMEISLEHHTRDGRILVNTSPDGLIIPRVAAYWDGDITVTYLGKES
jgi:hypothetical protein